MINLKIRRQIIAYPSALGHLLASLPYAFHVKLYDYLLNSVRGVSLARAQDLIWSSSGLLLSPILPFMGVSTLDTKLTTPIGYCSLLKLLIKQTINIRVSLFLPRKQPSRTL